MNRIKIIFIALLFMPLASIAQDEEIPSKKEQRKNRPTYKRLSVVGLGLGSIRDFATSPLTYSGITFALGGSKINLDEQSETEWGVPFNISLFISSFNDNTNLSTVYSISPYYSELFELKALSSEKLNVKVGGMLQATMNVRTNADLANNGVGLELIPTLFGSIKGAVDVSRKIDKNKKFLFIKYTLPKRKKSLALRLNTGLINASYRNGYAYSGQSFLLNEPKIFDDYKFRVFSGFRMSSSLDYTIYSKKTTNAIQYSYVWDAYTTGGNSDKFEMAQHALRIRLMFNTK